MTKPQDVGTRFPFINLEKAIGRARELYQADQRGRPMAVPTAFGAWSYSEKSSGGHQTVAALKMYDLIRDSGANAERRIALTEDALRYFADEREDERKHLLRKFALAPKLIAAVWQDWGATPPADNIARSYLKLDRKLNEQSARSFLSIYKDNIAFAELGDAVHSEDEAADNETDEGSGKFQDSGERPAIGDFIQWSPGGVDQFAQPAKVRAISPDGDWVFVEGSETGISVAEVSVIQKERRNDKPEGSATGNPPRLPLSEFPVGMRRDVFSLDEGEATITFPAVLTRASFDEFVDWLELVKRKAKRAIKSD